MLICYYGHFHGIQWRDLWGQSLHDFDPESHSGAHYIAPEAAPEIKAQAEAKLHM
jgi:hypothetical protein